MRRINSGLEALISDPEAYLWGQTIGLVVNQTSLGEDGRHSIDHFAHQKRFVLKKIFAPEHGLFGVDQDMVSVANSVDPVSGVQVTSLYGEGEQSLSPDPALLEGIDNLIFDIQDVGARYYTFIYTLQNCMRVCRSADTRIIVCDRPNPINGIAVEGNLVGEKWQSFVGQCPIPNRHGMTIGELATLFNTDLGIGCDLTVIPMNHWERGMWYDQTGLTWTPPSPNMPTLETATVYPGTCLIEGTCLSEGRGTTLPFQQIGAPYIDPYKLAQNLQEENLPGVFFRPQYFKPMYQKWRNETCGGIQLHITDRDKFKPLLTGIAIIRAAAKLYPDKFEWRKEPYEFVSDRPAIDLLYGNSDLREKFLNSNDSLKTIEDSWHDELEEFKKLRQEFIIY